MTSSNSNSSAARRLRSRAWFDDSANADMPVWIAIWRIRVWSRCCSAIRSMSHARGIHQCHSRELRHRRFHQRTDSLDRRSGTHRFAQGRGEHSHQRRRAGSPSPGVQGGGWIFLSAQSDPVAGNAARRCRSSRHGCGAGVGRQISAPGSDQGCAPAQSLSSAASAADRFGLHWLA